MSENQKKLLNLSPEDAKLLLEIGYLLANLKKYVEAKSVFQAILAMNPSKEAAMIGLGNIALQNREFEAAEASYRAAVAAHPMSAAGHAFLGELLLGTFRHDEGMAALRKAQEIDRSGCAGKFARQLMRLADAGFFQKNFPGRQAYVQCDN
jgi:tetratricopeptide (TPR) repeat protein